MFCRNYLIHLERNKTKQNFRQSTHFWVYIRKFVSPINELVATLNDRHQNKLRLDKK